MYVIRLRLMKISKIKIKNSNLSGSLYSRKAYLKHQDIYHAV